MEALILGLAEPPGWEPVLDNMCSIQLFRFALPGGGWLGLAKPLRCGA